MKTARPWRGCVMSIIVVIGLTSGILAQVTFDGTIHIGTGQEWGEAKANAVQDNYTGYGDQHLTPGGFGGSELDELYVRTDGTWLYIGATGNLEQNGNSIILLIDTNGTGQNVLATEIAPRPEEMPCAPDGPPTAVQGLGQALTHSNTADPLTDVTSRDAGTTGSKLDAGFAPNYAIALDTNGGQTYVTQYSLFATSQGTWDDPTTGAAACAPNPGNPASSEALPYYATRVYRGSGAVNSGNGTLGGGSNPNNSQYAFNNTNKLGVEGESTTPPPAAGSGLPGDPRSATSGLEAKIHLADLGYTVPVAGPLSIKLSVLLTSSSGLVSNQVLPPIGGGTSIANLGWRPDFTATAGSQYASVARTPAAFPGSINGLNVVTDFGTANLVASQDTVTSFGDRNCLTPTGGSELDELYMRTDGNYLYVAVTGNLEGNANAQILLLDVQPGGQNTLATEIAPVVTELPCSGNGPPVAVQGLGQALVSGNSTTPTVRDTASGGTVLDSGFEPDYAIAVDTSGGTVHVSQYSLSASSLGDWDDPSTNDGSTTPCTAPNETLPYYATRIYRGSIGVGAISTGPASLTGGTNPNGSEFAYNNAGTAGVTGSAVATPGSGSTGDPRTQTRGLEAKISLLDLGFAQGQLPVSSLAVKATVLLTATDGYLSNQTLPGLTQPSPYADLGRRPSFAAIAGNQYVTASLAKADFANTVDGKDLVNKYGAANVLASQDTPTSFGDVSLVPVTDCDQAYSPGSEIDQIWVQDVQSPAALQIALTGNMEGNGNNLVIFLDTIPSSGVSLMPTTPKPAGRLSGMSGVVLPLIPGTTTPMAADYAIVANNWAGTVYVDLVNLVANTSTYMGSAPANNGTGTLTGGAAVNWSFVLGNTNVLGVNGLSTSDPQSANASGATTGLELSIPLADLGTPTNGTKVNVFAIITNNDSSWLSNQVLPAGLGGARANFDNSKPDFATLGYSAASITLGPVGPVCNHPRFDINGDTFVDMQDFAAFQRCWTGQLPAGQIDAGCECFDWNFVVSDGKINLEDLAVFQVCAKGPEVPANPTCDQVP